MDTGAKRNIYDAPSPDLLHKEQIGHSSIQLTVNRYGHFIPGLTAALTALRRR